MDFSSFFDYPEADISERPEELIFLASQSPDDWEKIFACTGTRRYQRDEMVIHQGDTDRALYIVTRGSLEVVIPEGLQAALQRIATIEEGAVFGEQSFFDGKPRSANVRAITDGEILILSLEAFYILAAREPELARAILFDLARILSLRLRHTTAMMMELASR